MVYVASTSTLVIGGCGANGQSLASHWRLLASAPHYSRLEGLDEVCGWPVPSLADAACGRDCGLGGDGFFLVRMCVYMCRGDVCLKCVVEEQTGAPGAR